MTTTTNPAFPAGFVVGLSEGRSGGRAEAMPTTDPRVEHLLTRVEFPGMTPTVVYATLAEAEAEVADRAARDGLCHRMGYGQGRYQGD